MIHWVNANDCYRGQVCLYGRLFKVPNPGAEEDFLACVDENSKEIIKDAALESSLKNAKVGDSFQFEREGYFCVESKDFVEGAPVFNLTVALRDNKKTQA